MASKPKQYEGRLYLGRDESGRERYEWVGRFATEKERDAAVLRRRLEREVEAAAAKLSPGERITCGEYANEYLARMDDGRLTTKGGRTYKSSSVGTARGQLKRFTAEFGDRSLASITRHEAVALAESHDRKQSVLQAVVTMFGLAMDEELINRNPFRGVTLKPKGRADEAPPTDAEFERLQDACAVLGDHGPRMRALLTFAAFSGMRPGELMALDWSDVNLPALRVTVSKRLYRGGIDLPKSNKVRVIALTPPARDALLSLPEREGPVFLSKSGGRLCAALLSSYWNQVQAAAGLRFDFHLSTKHRCVHHFKVVLGLPNHVIAAQMGWSESAVESMIATYAHAEIGALDAIDAAFAALPDANPVVTLGCPARSASG
jgi:integrase